MGISEEAKQLHDESLVVDIHCHPSTKVELLKYKIYEIDHYFTPGLPNPFDPVIPSDEDGILPMQYDLQQMKTGGVNAIWSAIYVVEKGLIENAALLRTGFCIAHDFELGFDHIVERDDRPDRPYLQTMEIMEKMKIQVSHSSPEYNATIPKNFAQFQQAINEGKMCMIHTLEGAHHLGRGLTEQNYLDNLNALSLFGVCSMTISHFMPNDICYPIQGIAPHARQAFDFEYDYSAYEQMGLTSIGKKVVEEMLNIGMIIDLNHLSPQGRKEVYKINEDRGVEYIRPLTFTHNGVRKYCEGELVTPEDWEILEIKKSDGVIGIIFMNYWLNKNSLEHEKGMKYIIKTIEHIAKVCFDEVDGETVKNYDHISIGSDLDGFTTPMGDLYCASQMPLLTQALLKAGISRKNIRSILGGNAMRVMQKGWR